MKYLSCSAVVAYLGSKSKCSKVSIIIIIIVYVFRRLHTTHPSIICVCVRMHGCVWRNGALLHTYNGASCYPAPYTSRSLPDCRVLTFLPHARYHTVTAVSPLCGLAGVIGNGWFNNARIAVGRQLYRHYSDRIRSVETSEHITYCYASDCAAKQ